MIKRILVGLAGTPYTDVAIQQAVELAKSHDAELTGVTVVDAKRLESIGLAPIGAEEMGIELREHRRQVTSEHVDDVIAAFERLTGCAVVVNTSFNVRGEPIVCSPEDAYRCFMRTEMDVLVMEDCMLFKEEQPLWQEGRWWRDGLVLD